MLLILLLQRVQEVHTNTHLPSLLMHSGISQCFKETNKNCKKPNLTSYL